MAKHNDKNQNSRSKYGGKQPSKHNYKTRDDRRFEHDEDSRNKSKEVVINRASSFNDVDWYVHDAAELSRLGSLAYPEVTGVPAPLDNSEFRVAGICAMDVALTYGTSTSPDSALNAAVRSVTAQMRSHNSGSMNYSSTEYGFYNMLFDSIFAILNHIKRGIQAAQVHSTQNRYFPRMLTETMGFDFEEIMENKPTILAKYDYYIRKIAKWPVADNFPIFKRHAFMFGCIMMDSLTPKSQIYFYRPSGYYTFELGAEGTAGNRLKWNPIYYAGDVQPAKSMDFWWNVLDEMISPLYSHTIFSTMAGDTIKAFGDNVYKLALWNDAETLAVSLDEDVREQFMNATVIPAYDLDISDALVDDDPTEDFWLFTQPKYDTIKFPYDEGALFGDHVINTYRDPDPKTNIEITRLMLPLYSADADVEEYYTVFTTLGSEICERCYFYTIVRNQDPSVAIPSYNSVPMHFLETYGPDGNTINQFIDRIVRLYQTWAQFDYAPSFRVHIDGSGTASTDSVFTQPIMKTENWTIIDGSRLAGLNEMIIQREMGL